ncbi:coenzyme F420-0:L-glutamate ligase [Pedococcus aerophilus]|uniref:Coenzyme F420-0:L-glutamate ligase n=1 Tax=Pedococcus aerophilus TaxID=436356 RepID=A0ABP6HBB9_9MICO
MPDLRVIPVPGVPEVREDDDLAALLVTALRARGADLEEGDVLVVSSKVVSKALGLWADGRDRSLAIAAQTMRTVAERRSEDRLTSVVEAVAGPVMAAAGVDASNTGDRDDVLVLPADPDAEAQRLREALLAATGLGRLGVVLSDTAGRPWRSGQTDFALGASGVDVLDDLRGAVDADGRALAVTARAVADEIASAADLVKGKSDAVPAAVVRGTPWAGETHGAGARSLVRTGAGDWFALGHAEAVRSALGVRPGTEAAREVGIPSVAPESLAERIARAAAVALRECETAGVDVGRADGSTGAGDDNAASLDLQVSAATPYELGVVVARLQVALWGEGIDAVVPTEAGGDSLTLRASHRIH